MAYPKMAFDSSFEGLRKSMSVSSMSTRASSTESIVDLSARERTSKEQLRRHKYECSQATALQEKMSARKQRVLVVGCMAAVVLIWSRYVKYISRSTKRWGPAIGGAIAAALLSALGRALGISGRVGQAPDGAALPNGTSKRQAVVVMHPHGLFLVGPLFIFATGSTQRSSPWYGFYTAAADVVFQVPVFRELVLLLKGRAASKQTVDALLAEGHSVNIFAGGIHEQLATDPAQESCYFAPNLGFVRQAIRHGVPLQPVYSFGENQLFDVPAWARRFSKWSGIPMGIGPQPQPLLVQPGRAVEVGVADEHPSDEKVKRIFFNYCTELRRLFDEYKDVALPKEVAAKGLQLIWRGHEEVDISAVVSGSQCLNANRSGTMSRSQSEPILTNSRL